MNLVPYRKIKAGRPVVRDTICDPREQKERKHRNRQTDEGRSFKDDVPLGSGLRLRQPGLILAFTYPSVLRSRCAPACTAR